MMLSSPYIVEPGFPAIGLRIQPVFEMMAVNLVHVALWKSGRDLFQTPTEMTHVKPGTNGVGFGSMEGIDGYIEFPCA